MDKNQLLQLVKESVDKGEISKSEVNSLFQKDGNHASRIINILYAIGGIVILAGVIALIAQNWESLPSFARILTTLGMSIALYLAASLVVKSKEVLSQVLAAVSFALLPVGIGVSMYEGGSLIDRPVDFVVISGISTIVSVISYFTLKKLPVTIIFNTVFITALTYSFVSLIMENVGYTEFNVFTYLTMAIGISYIILGRYLSNERLRQLLVSIGTLGLLIAGITLSGLWDVLYIFILFAVFLLSSYWKKRSMLVFGSIFLISYLFEITSKYFAGSVGWPIALILLGILTIAIAIVTFRVSRKYINE
ncbi:MAG: DUF2157 domain-containing protein [Candidatus Pacebacteria bacterium]|nr:DUF2157 domain-containing protein [Candidatus Paceibacterota bacterium]